MIAAGSTANAHVFVYGTLRRAAALPMAKLLQPMAFLGEGRVAGRLYDLGRYPGLTPPRSASEWVRGELYALRRPNLTLTRLDDYEGCRSYLGAAEFVRQRREVRLDGGRVLSAWVYVYRGDLGHAALITSGDYCHKGRRSHRLAASTLQI